MENHITVAPHIERKPYQVLGQVLGFANYDQELWWLNTAPLLGNLLRQADYDLHGQYQCLALYYKHILPLLGPYIHPGIEPRWMGYFNSEGHPFETSLNFRNSEITVRLAFEPLSSLAGTDHDPLNQFMAREFLGQLARTLPWVDLQWFNHFDSELGLSLEQARLIASRIPKQGKTQRGIGLDLNVESGIRPKAYFYPEHKARVMGIPISKLIFNTIRKLDESKSFAPALNKLERFLAQGLESNTAEVFTVSIDCLVPSKSRIKLYLGDTHATLARARELWTLGGCLADRATLTGLGLIEVIWAILDMGDFKAEQLDFNYLPLAFFYELRQGSEYPKPQLYIPLHEKNDEAIANKMTEVLEFLKWKDIALRYKPQLMANL